MKRPLLHIIDRTDTPAQPFTEEPNTGEFEEVLALQEELVRLKAEDEDFPDVIIFAEHQDIYTAGRGSPKQSLLFPTKKNIPWIEIGRGGQATYHGPGQLVGYPIFSLERHGKDVHLFLRKLEDALILALQTFGIEGCRLEGMTGVWTRQDPEETSHGNNLPKIASRKIASLGIGVRRWVSFHGFALNIKPDLSYFQAISPCGQDGSVMTSLQEIFDRDARALPDMTIIKSELTKAIQQVFQFGEVKHGYVKGMSRPSWLKVRAPGSVEYQQTLNIVKDYKLVTVCEEAHCPNIGECWSHHTATFMIMGELCTRRCSFCSVKDGDLQSLRPLDPLEPVRVAQAIAKLGLAHVVVTSVNRDDLADMGAKHFNLTAKAIRRLNPQTAIEFLIPDMQGKRSLLEIIFSEAEIAVLNHNLETVPRLYREVRPGANIKRSLQILAWAKELSPGVRTKSGIMVGLGETMEEVLAVMDELRQVGCDILTIGQYLQPTLDQLPIRRYISPDEFARYETEGLKRGFTFVESGPFVRSSYHAWKHAPATQHPGATQHIGSAQDIRDAASRNSQLTSPLTSQVKLVPENILFE